MSAKDKTPAISACGLSVGYEKAIIVEQVELHIREGAFTALVGPNACGKSTLLRALCGLLPVQAGTVLVDGHAIATLPARQVARRLGMLGQSPVAPEGLTVLDLVRQGRYPHRSLFARWSAEDEAACGEALRLTGLEALADRSLDRLSGGQRQRAWIAMVLAQQSGILLLDEPTTYLDIAHQIDVLRLVRSLVSERNATVVAVLHDINQAASYADHIVMMKDGRIFAEGAPAQVLTPETIAGVFGVRARVVANPLDGTPLVLPER